MFKAMRSVPLPRADGTAIFFSKAWGPAICAAVAVASAICRQTFQPALAHQFRVPVAIAHAAGVQTVGCVHFVAALHKGIALFGLQQADVAGAAGAGNRLGNGVHFL